MVATPKKAPPASEADSTKTSRLYSPGLKGENVVFSPSNKKQRPFGRKKEPVRSP